MDIQIINLRVPSGLAHRIRERAGSRGLTAFFIRAAEEALGPPVKAVATPPPAGPKKSVTFEGGIFEAPEAPNQAQKVSRPVQAGPDPRAISNLLRKS